MKEVAAITIDQDTLIAYALGILSEEETLLVGSHLRKHPDDTLELKGYLNALTAIVMSEEPETVPEDAENNLLERIRSLSKSENEPQIAETEVIQFPSKDSKQGLNRWWFGLAAAAIVAIILWFGFLQDNYNNYLISNELRAAQQKEGAISQEIINETNEIIGTLVSHSDHSLLVIFNKDPLSPNVYQAWEIAEGIPKSLGIWGNRVMRIDPLAKDSIFGVTLEPQGGSEQPTSKPIILFEL